MKKPNRNCFGSWIMFAAFVFFQFNATTSSAQEKASGNGPPVVAALNAYSFSDLLMAKDSRNGQQVYTLFNLLDWCATQNIKAIDPTAYFFPTYPEVPSDEYLKNFRDRAAALGIVISGTGIRNNFASADPAVRAAGVKLAKEWIIAASKMGAPVVRLFAGEIPKGYENNWKEVAGWMIDCYKECTSWGEKYGVKIGIQNHGDMLQTSEQCIYIMKAVNSKWAGLIVDVGNFKTPDPYVDIAAVVPYAFNWQIKESVFGLGSDIQTDYKRLVRIINDGGYKGYLPIETLSERGKPYDPFARVLAMLSQLNAAINEALIPAADKDLNHKTTFIPAGYKGKPFLDQRYVNGAQVIPGKIECAMYDIGGEGVAFHDLESQNRGSGGLNLEPNHHRPHATPYEWEFRKNEAVDLSYTKDFADFNHTNNYYVPAVNQFYIGWTENNEWVNYTVDVKVAGRYTVEALYAFKDTTITFDVDQKKASTCKLPLNTGGFHAWNKGVIGTIEFTEPGLHLLTFHYNKGNNFAYFEFTLTEKRLERPKPY